MGIKLLVDLFAVHDTFFSSELTYHVRETHSP